MDEMRNAYKDLVGKLEGKHHLEDLGVVERKLLKYILEHGFSNCGTRTTTGTPTIVYWYAALIKRIEI
jgi:hypothetical protein